MARRLPEGDAGLLLIKEGKMSQELLFMILAGLAEALVLYLFIKNGIKQGLVHELGTILSMAAAVLVLYLVMRVFHGFTDAQYDKVVVGIVMLVLVSAVFSVCRLIFFAVKMAAKLPVSENGCQTACDPPGRQYTGIGRRAGGRPDRAVCRRDDQQVLY